jgi:hypothetical protein
LKLQTQLAFKSLKFNMVTNRKTGKTVNSNKKTSKTVKSNKKTGGTVKSNKNKTLKVEMEAKLSTKKQSLKVNTKKQSMKVNKVAKMPNNKTDKLEPSATHPIKESIAKKTEKTRASVKKDHPLRRNFALRNQEQSELRPLPTILHKQTPTLSLRKNRCMVYLHMVD